jgi:hypothetical protein
MIEIDFFMDLGDMFLPSAIVLFPSLRVMPSPPSCGVREMWGVLVLAG